MKKIGRISELNRRVVRQNLATSMSLLIGKERFSGVFSREIEKYEVGDLVEIKYKKVGFLNKMETIWLIAKKTAKNQGFLQGSKIYFICLLPCIFVFLLWELSIMGSRWNLSFIGFLLC
ncbi:hypothetical protein [Campylobacter sp.]|uniref:hypothetical protein n=1 Tax=Campylobacter sp. TaxID=205 RepID=UPI003F9F4658